MHVSAKVDYGLRALMQLTGLYRSDSRAVATGESIATAQAIPASFLEVILRQLRLAGLVTSVRGVDGGYRLARDPAEICVADVIRALDGPLADVRGSKPEDAQYEGPSEHLREVWIAVRAAIRGVLEHVTLADVLDGQLPPDVQLLLSPADAWHRR